MPEGGTAQITLAGTEVRGCRNPSDTMLWCDECKTWFLASYRYEHPHDLYESPEMAELLTDSERDPDVE